MNQHTKHFHESLFPGYHLSQDAPKITQENFWFRRDIPIVDLDVGLDTTADREFLQQHHARYFTEMDSQVNRRIAAEKENRSWYFTPHSHGWENCVVSGDLDFERVTMIKGTQLPADVFVPQFHRDVLPNIMGQLKSLGMSVFRLWVMSLEPNGWVLPHVDPKRDDIASMAHFWIPLGDGLPTLKFWPGGYLQHKAGHIYLFNNQHWTHSVWNRDPVHRYVLGGLLDLDCISQSFQDLAVTSAQQQWEK